MDEVELKMVACALAGFMLGIVLAVALMMLVILK